jgi:hypothetical protein
LTDRGVGAVGAGFALLAAGQAEFLEQDIAELLGRPDIEMLPTARKIACSISAMRRSKPRDRSARAARSTLIPSRSIAATTETSGRSFVSCNDKSDILSNGYSSVSSQNQRPRSIQPGRSFPPTG